MVANAEFGTTDFDKHRFGEIPPVRTRTSNLVRGSNLPAAMSQFYRKYSKAWWLKKVHVHLDNKHFKVALTVFGRRLLAKRKCRGCFRRKGKSLRPGHVRPDPKLRINTGTKVGNRITYTNTNQGPSNTGGVLVYMPFWCIRSSGISVQI
jgi:hypothetical protein